MSYILPFAFLATIFFMLSLIIGDFLLKKVTKTSSNEITVLSHYSSFVGVILLVSFFSLFYSGFKTVNVFAIMLMLVYFVLNFNKNNLKRKVDFKNILKKTLTFFILFIIVSIFHVFAAKEELDVLFYGGMLSNGIHKTGVESFYGYYNEYLSPDLIDKVNPYHYFEIWMTVMFKQLPLGYSFIMVLKYLVYVFLETYIVMSLYALLRYLNLKVNWLTYLFIIIASIFPLKLVLGFFNNSWAPFQFDFWNYPNFILYTFIIINSLTMLIKDDFKNGLFILLFLPVISITTAPSILATVFMMAFYLYFTKKFSLKDLIFLNVTSVILAVLILAFYKLFGGTIEPFINNNDHWVLRYKNAWKAIVYILGVVNITILVFLILVGKFNNRLNVISSRILNKILIICFLAVSIGIFMFQLVFYIDNSYQFVYAGYSFIFIVFVLLILVGIYSETRMKYLSYGLLLTSFLFFGYNIPSKKLSDIRVSEFNYFEKCEINNSKKELDLIFNKKGKVIVVLNEETLPYVRCFNFRVPLSGLFFMGDYQIITMVDKKIMYNPVEKRVYDAGYDKAKIGNSKMPKEWFNLEKIDEVATKNEALFIAVPLRDKKIRSKVGLQITDSLIISNYKLLFLK